MFFSVGNLITLVIVLLILVIYRTLDRNNRTLEKLKRFSDKIMENLSAAVEEKGAQVKELALELDANLKSGREPLGRALQAEEALDGKAGELDGIQRRISDYDHPGGAHRDVRPGVDQNLASLREESQFVDGLGRSIQAGVKLMEVEKRLPQMKKHSRATPARPSKPSGARAAPVLRERRQRGERDAWQNRIQGKGLLDVCRPARGHGPGNGTGETRFLARTAGQAAGGPSGKACKRGAPRGIAGGRGLSPADHSDPVGRNGPYEAVQTWRASWPSGRRRWRAVRVSSGLVRRRRSAASFRHGEPRSSPRESSVRR